MAPLVQSAVLTDRRHLLTKDADGNVDLWDIATATVTQHFGKVLQALQMCLDISRIHIAERCCAIMSTSKQTFVTGLCTVE